MELFVAFSKFLIFIFVMGMTARIAYVIGYDRGSAMAFREANDVLRDARNLFPSLDRPPSHPEMAAYDHNHITEA